MAWFSSTSRIRRRPQFGPVILMYHRIAAVTMDPWELAVPPAVFHQQMRDIASKKRVLPLDEFAARHLEGSLGSDAAAITFDDGYACNALVAAPLLEALGLPATFFLATAMLGNSEEFWNDALERVIFDPRAGGSASIAIQGRDFQIDLGQQPVDRLGPRWRAMQELPKTAREHAYLKVWEILKSEPFDRQYQAIESIARQIGSELKPRSSHRPMTIEEARKLSHTSGMDIAGHTHTHVSLPQWDRYTQIREIRQSRQICETVASRPCNAFAYPYGDYSVQTIDCAKTSGLTCAVSAYPKLVSNADLPLALPRIMIRDDTNVGDWIAG